MYRDFLASVFYAVEKRPTISIAIAKRTVIKFYPQRSTTYEIQFTPFAHVRRTRPLRRRIVITLSPEAHQPR